MKCPNCGLVDHESKVMDSRPFKNTIKRTRKCTYCGNRWKTYEILEDKYLYLASRDKTGRKAWTEEECKNLVSFKEQGLTYRQIAERFGRTQGSVKTHTMKLLETGEYFTYLEELENRRITK